MWQIFCEISTFAHEMHPTYIPSGVGADSSCPYFSIAKSVFSHHQIHIFVSSQTHFRSPFCGYIRIWGHDKSTPTAANGLPTTLLTDWNNVANILWDIHIHPRKHHVHSARRRGRFIVPVSLHCQIRIYTLSNTHIRFIANTFLFPILWIYTDMRAR